MIWIRADKFYKNNWECYVIWKVWFKKCRQTERSLYFDALIV